MPRRVLFVWFPNLAAERVLRRIPLDARPECFAVVAMRRNALRLCSLNDAARRRGLRVGMALADARAIQRDLVTTEEEPGRDATFLRALGRWALRYTPIVAIEGDDGLSLDLTGCSHLFGGDAALVADLAASLERRGLTVLSALAETRAAARAVARFGEPGTIVACGHVRESITALPVEALTGDTEKIAGLRRLGLHRIGDLDGLPRASIARRFGVDLIAALDRMRGIEPDPVVPWNFTAPHAVRLSLPEPVGHLKDMEAATERLLARLCIRLERERKGTRRLRLSVRRADGGGDAVEIGMGRPSRDEAAILRQVLPELPKLDAGFGIDMVRLEALSVEALEPEQHRTFDEDAGQRDRLADLVGRLGNRIGFERVTRFLPAESHIPEKAFTIAAAAYSASETFPMESPPRPMVLFSPEPVIVEAPGQPPDRFRWRRMTLETARATGPERIAPEWWWDDPAWRSGPRDYWRVETVEGRRLWLYRLPAGDWFAHGEFA